MTNYLKTDWDYNSEKLVEVYDELKLWAAPSGLKRLEGSRYKEGIRALDIDFGTGFPLMEIAMRPGDESRDYGIDPWESAARRVQKMICYFVLLPVFFFTLTPRLDAQENFEVFSVNPKAGVYLSGEDGGFTGGLALNAGKNGLLYSIDYIYFEELQIIFGDSPDEYFNHLGVMIGKYYGKDLFGLQLQCGVASFWGLRRTRLISEGGYLAGDKYGHEKFLTAGLAMKVGLKIIPLDFLSVGLDLQTNINPKSTVFMPMLSIGIGRLKKNHSCKK